jgi:hypothetical protein
MNLSKLTGLICGGLISLVGSNLIAQQSSPSSSLPDKSSGGGSPNSSALQTPSGGAYNNSSSSGTTAGQWRSEGGSVRLGHLMNAAVQSRDGKSLGYIRDFTVDPQSGHIQFAILSSTADMNASNTGISSTTSPTTGAATGKLIPVPWQLFSESWSQRQHETAGVAGATAAPTLVLNIDESKLQGAPSFDASSWNELHQRQFDQRVYSYYGVNHMSGTGTSGSSISGQGSTSEGNSTSGAKGGGSELPNK